ncbi:MAG: hypothetical protein QNJ46_15870 [Leptolyngbyaceae cyanobacterium MO_188.B28]|nr:hypothetical protein [Leptolyngbyaceae cyanobacterium MO_188.B28]
MMQRPPVPFPQFSIETVDGARLGKLGVPLFQISDWLNFLVTPHYQAEIISTEQEHDWIEIYFEAGEGLYAYLDGRLSGFMEAA